MRRYFKHEADIGYGPGMAYFEFDGEWAKRQVEVYGDRWTYAREDYSKPGLRVVDQPLSELGFGRQHEMSQEEFEQIWAEAVRRGENISDSA